MPAGLEAPWPPRSAARILPENERCDACRGPARPPWNERAARRRRRRPAAGAPRPAVRARPVARRRAVRGRLVAPRRLSDRGFGRVHGARDRARARTGDRRQPSDPLVRLRGLARAGVRARRPVRTRRVPLHGLPRARGAGRDLPCAGRARDAPRRPVRAARERLCGRRAARRQPGVLAVVGLAGLGHHGRRLPRARARATRRPRSETARADRRLLARARVPDGVQDARGHRTAVRRGRGARALGRPPLSLVDRARRQRVPVPAVRRRPVLLRHVRAVGLDLDPGERDPADLAPLAPDR